MGIFSTKLPEEHYQAVKRLAESADAVNQQVRDDTLSFQGAHLDLSDSDNRIRLMGRMRLAMRDAVGKPRSAFKGAISELDARLKKLPIDGSASDDICACMMSIALLKVEYVCSVSCEFPKDRRLGALALKLVMLTGQAHEQMFRSVDDANPVDSRMSATPQNVKEFTHQLNEFAHRWQLLHECPCILAVLERATGVNKLFE